MADKPTPPDLRAALDAALEANQAAHDQAVVDARDDLETAVPAMKDYRLAVEAAVAAREAANRAAHDKLRVDTAARP